MRRGPQATPPSPRSPRAFFMGLDLGTTGAKALLVDERGRVVRRGEASYPLRVPRSGFVEQSPEHWRRAALAALRDASGSLGGSVLALGLTGQMHGSVFLNGDGRPVRPAILWCDQRTERECAEIESIVGSRQLRRITGNPALEGFTAPKVLWLRRHEPRCFSRTRHLLLPKDYIRLALTGVFETDVSDASGTMLFDVPRRRWSERMLEALEIPREWLPDVFESPEPRSGLLARPAREAGLPNGLLVIAGAGDCAAGAVGSGIVGPGPLSLSIGTSGVLFADSASPILDPEGRLHAFCHAVPGRWHLMGVMLMAGGSLRYLRDVLFQGSRPGRSGGYREIDRLAASVSPGADGLVYLPYLSGERTPHKDPRARASFVGLGLQHGRAHLARAVLEGVAFAMKDSLDVFREIGVDADRVRLSGGGARSRLWRQILADVLELPVETLATDEGPAYGAALLASVGAGAFPSVAHACRSWVRAKRAALPRSSAAARYRELHRIFRSLYPSLRQAYSELTRFQEARPGPRATRGT